MNHPYLGNPQFFRLWEDVIQAPFKHCGEGQDCPECAKKKVWDTRGRWTTDIFIEKAKAIFGDLYDYSEVEFKNANKKVKIRCREHDLIFEKTPNKHLGYKQGCPLCGNDSYFKEFLLKGNIINEFKDYVIVGQESPDWLGRMSFDIFFKDYNIAVEYHGGQHFKPVKIYGGEPTFIKQRERDIKKHILSIENNCKVFYFTYTKSHIKDYPYYVYSNEKDLFSTIKKEIELRITI